MQEVPQPPFGSRCTNWKELPVNKKRDIPELKTMAECVPGSGFTNREDAGYLEFLEKSFMEGKKREFSLQDTLKDITDRLEHLETVEIPKVTAHHGGELKKEGGSRAPPAQPGSTPGISPADFVSLSDSIHQLSASISPDSATHK